LDLKSSSESFRRVQLNVCIYVKSMSPAVVCVQSFQKWK